MIEELEKLIDHCNDVLDGESEAILFVVSKREGKETKFVMDQRSVKNIKTLAYVLRNAIHDAIELEE